MIRELLTALRSHCLLWLLSLLFGTWVVVSVECEVHREAFLLTSMQQCFQAQRTLENSNPPQLLSKADRLQHSPPKSTKVEKLLNRQWSQQLCSEFSSWEIVLMIWRSTRFLFHVCELAITPRVYILSLLLCCIMLQMIESEEELCTFMNSVEEGLIFSYRNLYKRCLRSQIELIHRNASSNWI